MAYSMGIYESDLRKLIHDAKIGARTYALFTLKRSLALSALTLFPNTFDGVVSIPYDSNRLGQRGFDLSHDLAKHVAKSLQIPHWYKVLYRGELRPKQSELNHHQRQRNLKNSFKFKHRMDGQRVLIIDDVATTFCTIFETARALNQAGVKSISALVIAKTPKRFDPD